MSLFILQPDAAGNCCDCEGRTEPCDSCAGSTCSCYDRLSADNHITNSVPFSSYEDAYNALVAQTSFCYLKVPSFMNLIGVTLTLSPNNFYLSSLQGLGSFFALSVKAGTIMTFDVSISVSATPACTTFECRYDFPLFDCTGQFLTRFEDIQPVSSLSASHNYTVLQDTVIYISVSLNSSACCGPGCSVNQRPASFRVTANQNFVPIPVTALWYDSFSIHQLEACPKMLLPPLTESTDTWYANCASAATAITDHVSNCIGYISQLPFTSFTATDGGTSFTLNATAAAILSGGTYGRGIAMWGSLNLINGSTLTVTITMSTSSGTLTGATQDYYLYDQYGTLVDSQSGPGGYSGPIVFNSSISVRGRYIVAVSVTLTGHPLAFNLTTQSVFTSTAAMSVNPVQALYNVGVDCPARLNCGDSC